MIFSFPLKADTKLLVKTGQKVDLTTSLFEEQVERETRIIISDKLQVPSKKIFQYIKKVVGDEVQKGEVLAEKKSLFSTKRYKSEWAGILKEINHTDGSVLIAASTDASFVQKAFFVGEIVKIEKNAIQIKIEKAKEYPVKEVGILLGGKVFYLKEQGEINEEMVGGCIVVAESISGYTQMKLETLGAIGFATLHTLSEISSVPRMVFSQIKDYEDIMKRMVPYCIMPLGASKIVFYE